MGLDPALTVFAVTNFNEYIRRYKNNEAYINKASALTDTGKPEQFNDKMKWIDWYTTLINFLTKLSVRNGVPLSYLCRPTKVQAKAAYNYFIDEYVAKAPQVGQEFTTDTLGVHTYIVRLTSGSTVPEPNMVAHVEENNGCLDFIELNDHYEGVGVHAVNSVQAYKVLNDLFYSGEKKPHIWQDEFERKLTDAFNTYNCLEKRSVHSNDMRLRILNKKYLSGFPPINQSIYNLAKTPVTITYENTLSIFCNQVNQNLLPELSSSNNRRTSI